MVTISRFFMLFLLCNATNALHAMNDRSHAWNDCDASEHYIKTKNLTKQKIERQKKHQNLHSKKKHIQAASINLKKAAK